jgi:hypothetical protein
MNGTRIMVPTTPDSSTEGAWDYRFRLLKFIMWERPQSSFFQYNPKLIIAAIATFSATENNFRVQDNIYNATLFQIDQYSLGSLATFSPFNFFS